MKISINIPQSENGGICMGEDFLNNNKQGNSSLGIASLVLTLLGCTAIIGVILAIVDLCNRDGKKKTLSKISLCICALWIIIPSLAAPSVIRRNKRIHSDDIITEASEDKEITTRNIIEETTEKTRITTEATTKVTTEATTEEMKPARNGWNDTSNNILYFDDYCFELPDYLVENERDDNMLSLSGDNKNVVAYFVVYKENSDFDFNNITTSFINSCYEKRLEEMKELGSFELIDSTVLKYEGIDNTKSSVRTYNLISGKNKAMWDYQIIFDGDRGKTIQVLLISDNKSEYDYSDDFDKIEQSIRLNDSIDKTDTSESSSGMRPEFKEMMDSYEAFMDEYVDFMKHMSDDPTDLEVLSEYADIMMKYAEWGKKIEDLDESEMSDEEAAYYAEVTLRVSQKLLEVSITSGD